MIQEFIMALVAYDVVKIIVRSIIGVYLESKNEESPTE